MHWKKWLKQNSVDIEELIRVFMKTKKYLNQKFTNICRDWTFIEK